MLYTIEQTKNSLELAEQTANVRTFVVSSLMFDEDTDYYNKRKSLDKIRQKIKDASVEKIAYVIAYMLNLDVSHVSVKRVYNTDINEIEYYVSYITDYDVIAEDGLRSFVRMQSVLQQRTGFSNLQYAWKYANKNV